MQECGQEVRGEGGGEREGRREKRLNEGEVRMRAKQGCGRRGDNDTLRAGANGQLGDVHNQKAQ